MKKWLFLILILLSSSIFAKVQVIAVMDFKSSKIRYTTIKKLSKSIRLTLKKNKKLYVVDEKLMNSVLQMQNVKNNCFDNPCYFGMGSLMGAQLMVTGEIYREGKTFDVKMFLLDISNREIIGKISFSSNKKYKYVKARILRNVANLFKVKPKAILTNSRLKLVEGEKHTISYNLSPTTAYDDIVMNVTNSAVLQKVGNKTVVAKQKGSSFIILKSESNPNVTKRISVNVIRNSEINFSYEKPKKRKRINSADIGQIVIKPYLMLTGSYNGPTYGGGLSIAFDKLNNLHQIFLKGDFSILNKGVWWYKEGQLSGFGLGYKYRGFEKYTPGFAIGSWKYSGKTYFEDKENYLEIEPINYYLDLILAINFTKTELQFDLLVDKTPTLMFSIGRKFNF